MSLIMNSSAFVAKGFTISTDKSQLDIKAIFNYLCNESYWAKGITLSRIEKAIKNCICYGIYHHGKQVGFARVITDRATFAYLADVFVLQTYRRQGLSKWLIQTILNDDDFKGLRRWLLATMDAQGLYSQFGFTSLQQPERWMNIFTPYTTE